VCSRHDLDRLHTSNDQKKVNGSEPSIGGIGIVPK